MSLLDDVRSWLHTLENADIDNLLRHALDPALPPQLVALLEQGPAKPMLVGPDGDKTAAMSPLIRQALAADHYLGRPELEEHMARSLAAQ